MKQKQTALKTLRSISLMFKEQQNAPVVGRIPIWSSICMGRKDGDCSVSLQGKTLRWVPYSLKIN